MWHDADALLGIGRFLPGCCRRPLLPVVDIPPGPAAAAVVAFSAVAAVSGTPAAPVDVGKDPAHAATACVLRPSCAGISAAVPAAAIAAAAAHGI